MSKTTARTCGVTGTPISHTHNRDSRGGWHIQYALQQVCQHLKDMHVGPSCANRTCKQVHRSCSAH